MGKYKFRLSYMIPNAWFYKLKDMSKTKTTNTTTTTTNHHKKPPSTSYYSSSTTTTPPQNHHLYQPKNSFHNSPKFPHFHDPQTKPSKRSKPNTKNINKPSSKPTESTHTLQDFFPPPSESTQSRLTSCACRLRPSISHIILDVNEAKNVDISPEIIELHQLPPIITKPARPTSRNRQTSLSGKKVKESNKIPARKSTSGVKLRSNSPKLPVIERIVQKSAYRKNSLAVSESFAIVKSSFDPEKDFMQSMMEMIVENNIRSTKDLEELLACYLSLNSDEYHDVIIKAFEQIWLKLPDL